MSARRILIVSLLISLAGHLIIFTAFSTATFKKVKRPPELTRFSFLGEFLEEKAPLQVEAVIGKEKIPQLQPMVREPEIGPGISFNKPRLKASVPRISGEEISTLLQDKEKALLKLKESDERKENPPAKLHLLEKEQKK